MRKSRRQQHVKAVFEHPCCARAFARRPDIWKEKKSTWFVRALVRKPGGKGEATLPNQTQLANPHDGLNGEHGFDSVAEHRPKPRPIWRWDGPSYLSWPGCLSRLGEAETLAASVNSGFGSSDETDTEATAPCDNCLCDSPAHGGV